MAREPHRPGRDAPGPDLFGVRPAAVRDTRDAACRARDDAACGADGDAARGTHDDDARGTHDDDARGTHDGATHRPPGTDRAALLARWLLLTREVLPGMAARRAWPIALDHCFMRVCLDAAVGARWDTVVRRPALRHLTDAQMAAAVGVAEGIVADPSRLPAVNAASLRMRATPPRAMPRRSGA